MFGLALRFVKMCGYLFVILLVILLALNFQVVYRGQGQFSVRPKEAWAFQGTFVSESAPSPSSTAQPKPQESVPPAESLLQGVDECRRLRKTLSRAVHDYNEANPSDPMHELSIFTLLADELIVELPNCPAGGEFSLDTRTPTDIRIHCSRHIE